MKLSKITNIQLKRLINEGHVMFSNPVPVDNLIKAANGYKNHVKGVLWTLYRKWLDKASHEIKGDVREILALHLRALEIYEKRLYTELDQVITSLKRLSH